jgi:outer membrane autotransporter protein
MDLVGTGTPHELADAFAQLHGEVFAGSKMTGVNLQKNFLRQLPGVLDLYMNTDDGIYRGVAPCEKVGCASVRWNRWASFTGDWLERKGIGKSGGLTPAESGYDLRSAGVVVGMDRKIARNAFGGFAFGYDNAYQSFKTIPSNNQMDAFRSVLYGGVQNRKVYADGYIGYTKDWNKTRRDINFAGFTGTARSKFDDDLFSTGVEIGERLSFGKARLTPSLALHYMHLSSPSVTESGAGAANLLVRSGSYDSLRMPVGARLSREILGNNGILWRPEVRAFYVREFADASVRTSTSFAAVSSVPFYAESGNWGRNSGRFGVGLNAGLANWLNFRVDYDHEVYDHTATNEFSATLGVKW